MYENVLVRVIGLENHVDSGRLAIIIEWTKRVCSNTKQLRLGTASPRPITEAVAIRSWVELPEGFPEGIGFIEKEIHWSGDSIALGIVQGFTMNELLDQNRISRIVSIIRLSFAHPESIERDGDRVPSVSMVLLSILEHDCKDDALKSKIIDTRKYIAAQLQMPLELFPD
jgi:hypothetical protein